MKAITITSQGQITIPVAVRQAWGIKGSEKLQASFNPETKRLIIEKPLLVDEFLQIASTITANISSDIKPLQGEAIGEFYRSGRGQEIIRKTREGGKK